MFGGRKLFEKLKRKHLTGKRREKLREEWKERRQGTAYARGDRSKKGNLNLRFVFVNRKLRLRINTGRGNYVYAGVHRRVQRGRAERDRWVSFLESLIVGESTGEYLPYSVELKRRNGKVYALVSFSDPIPEVSVTRKEGVIGIDINANPFHIAWAEVKEDGNLAGFGRISLHEFFGKNRGAREALSWRVAHEVVALAREKGRAIAVEDIRKLSKGRRGDGRRKLRKRLQRFIYRGILRKIEVLARRAGIEVARVNPAFTSVIGQLKYAPRYRLDKDVAGAFVVGRRGMGYREEIPENYLKLLSGEDFLSYSLHRLSERKSELRRELEGESNRWKGNAVRAELRKVNADMKLVRKELKELFNSLRESSGSDPAARQRASGGNKPVRGLPGRRKSWRVLRAVLVFPLLGKFFARDFSPLKPALVSGIWERAARRPAPAPGAGATAYLTNVQFP